MKILYLDCGMGAAGDMLTAALLELLPEDEQDQMLDRLQRIGLEGVTVTRERVTRCGIAGTHMDVRIDGIAEISDDEHGHTPEHHHEHHHADDTGHQHNHYHHHHVHMSDIESIISGLDISDKAKRDTLEIYRLIAEAESHAHGVDTAEVHFHEVGMKDAIMDVAAVCVLMEQLAPDKVVASPVQVGSGQVTCAHGTVPVPAPATAYILRHIPIYSTDIRGELCTPTGAALLRYFADEFGPMPVMSVSAAGYGMGTKEFSAANCLRAMLGESADQERSEAADPISGGGSDHTDTVIGLACNVDDMTGEEIGFAMDMLYEAGAREVYTSSIGMKKSRPGIMLTVLCDPEAKDMMVREIFRHTTTLGIRENVYNRYILKRSIGEADSPYGKLHYKKSEGYGVSRIKYEYDDLSGIAKTRGRSIREIKESIE